MLAVDLGLPSAHLMVGLVEVLVQVRVHVLVHVLAVWSRCVRGYRPPGAALVSYPPRVHARGRVASISRLAVRPVLH